MIYRIVSSKAIRTTLRCLLPAFCLNAILFSQDLDHVTRPAHGPAVRAKVILGLEGISNNSTGELSIQNDALVFHRSERSIVRIPIGSVQNVSLSQEDKQIGGTPMALGKAAAPFEGGRVVGLFAHKKYDFVTMEYVDSNGGLHGVICQLTKGQGQVLADELETKGVHVAALKVETAQQKPENKNEVK